jgi:hypothetical protein
MPSSLVIAAYFGAGAAGVAAATAAWGVAGVVAARFAINFAVSMLVTRLFSSGSANQNIDNGVRQQVPPATTNSLPIVYGDAYLAGVFVDAVLSTDQKTMYYVLAVSQISPNGQFSFDTTKMYWQDQTMTFDGTDQTKVISLTDGAGNVQTKISGNLNIYLYKSNEAGTITALNGTALPSTVMGGADIAVAQRWPSSGRQMNGLAFAIVKMVYNRDAGTTQMQAITFKAAQYLNSTGVAKPGDVWYDYITNDKYGCAMDASIVDAATATALNSYSDQTITYTPAAGGSATQARYRVNGVLDTGQDVLSNLDQIMLSCDSWNQYNAATGKWSIVINKAETTSFAFDDSNIVGEIRVSAFDISASINEVQAQFPSKLNRDQSDYVYLNTPSGLLFANEPVNKYTIALGLVNDSVQAQYLANRMLEQAREDLIVTFATTYNGIQVDAGDVISVTNAAYGWSAKLFRVIKVSEASLPDGNLGAALELNEYNPVVYDDASITAFAATPNSNLSNPNFFTNLVAPTVANINTTATIPHFDIVCGVPATGRTTEITLFYTNVSSPTTTDWKVWSFQSATNSQPFAPSTNVTFTDLNLPTDTYYFAFKVANETGASALSATSTSFNWNPNPTTSAVAGTFLATFSPVTIQVPRNSSLVPSFTGLITKLFGSAAGGSIDFVTSQTDADAAFVNNTWRIGGSSTTGNADISAVNITLGSLTDGGTFAQWAIPTAMSASPATLTVPVRYKSALGVVTQGATAILQYVFQDQGATGSPGTNGNQSANPTLYQWSTTTPSATTGSSTYTWATGVNSSYTGGGGWAATIPANPGTAGIQLWTAIKPTVVTVGTTTSTINWTTGVTVASVTANGANGSNGTNGTNGVNGLQTASPKVYQWAITIPASPTGTSTYTWATSSFTPTPSSWSSSITAAPSAGYTLWAATVNISDTATATTTSINWGLSSIIASGYAGTNGSNGTNGTNGADGTNGTRTAILDVYKWAASAPTTFPSGSSTYTWATGQFTAPASLNGWSLIPPTPVLGQTLWIARTVYADNNTTTTTSITWTASVANPRTASGVDGSTGATGANGARTAVLEIYKWSATTPTTFPSGTSTYTWSNGSFTAPSTANGWSLLPGTSTAGYTLYACSVAYVDTLTTSTSSVTWTTSNAYAVGAAGANGANGTNGANGSNGANGIDGLSSRICYAKSTLTSLNPTPAYYVTTGAGAFPPDNEWGGAEIWQATPPTIFAGEALFQSDGIYNPGTTQTTWNVPYLSNLKVGSLSAITANTGDLTVSGTIQSNTAAISGTTMTGAGAVIYSSGNFALGNPTTNISFDGTQMSLNGNVVATDNINLAAVSVLVNPSLTTSQTFAQPVTINTTYNGFSYTGGATVNPNYEFLTASVSDVSNGFIYSTFFITASSQYVNGGGLFVSGSTSSSTFSLLVNNIEVAIYQVSSSQAATTYTYFNSSNTAIPSPCVISVKLKTVSCTVTTYSAGTVYGYITTPTTPVSTTSNGTQIVVQGFKR